MTEASEREIIIEHALENTNNLEIALDIGLAYPDLRRQIIVAFIKKFDRFVSQRLNDESQWVVNSEWFLAKPFERFTEFFVEKKAWAGRYRVSLCAESKGAREFIIGVEKQAQTIPSIEGLKQALDKQVRQGIRSADWDWYHPLEQPYRNWDNKEALMKLYDGTAVNQLGEYFLHIVNVAASGIDASVG